ncbi:uncharacterized protein V1513DRAFT_443754 [Lipomyces chichibuensis]|uniref:uncharacterized protein n=1 Tax=Lipomyces chichibuensis TaxID=1546026 RepID=UPI003343A73B
MQSSILDFPTEILVDIFLIVILSSDRPEPCQGTNRSSGSRQRERNVPSSSSFGNALAGYLTLSPTDSSSNSSVTSSNIHRAYALGLVCKRFYSVIHHPSQDVRIWKSIAKSFGYDESLILGSILKCATSSVLPQGSWRKAAYVAAMWNRPFKTRVGGAGLGRVKTIKSVSKSLPSPPSKGITRTIDLAAPGQGRSGPTYVTLEPSYKDAGKLFAQSIDSREENPRSVSTIYGIVSPETSSRKIIFRGMDQDISTLDLSLPNQSNLVMEECTLLSENGDITLGYEISRHSPSTGKKERIWRLHEPPPERYIANGDLLLALYSPNMVFFWTGSPDNPARLQCYQAVSSLPVASASSSSIPSPYSSSNSLSALNSVSATKSWSAQSLSFASTRCGVFAACNNGKSELLWDINLSRDWSNDSPREQFCVVRNMKMTSRYAVVLVHWYPTSSMHKLSGTSFRILHLRTGETKNIMMFNQPDLSAPYPMFTTVSDHDFVVTDTHIVSGGPNGELYVWNYHMQNTPLYSIPEPDTRRLTHVEGSFAPMYTYLTISVDGKYLVATANNRITVWDMFSKKVEGVYHNGRKVTRRDFYLRNPFDNFRTGIWILYRDWRKKKRRATALERLVSDNSFVEEYELVSEKFKYIMEPFGKEELEPNFAARGGLIGRYIISTELINLFEALRFWIRWLFMTIWAYGYFLLVRAEKIHVVPGDGGNFGRNDASNVHSGNTNIGYDENEDNNHIHQE